MKETDPTRKLADVPERSITRHGLPILDYCDRVPRVPSRAESRHKDVGTSLDKNRVKLNVEANHNPLIKVRWKLKRPEFTWEREDQFKKKYPHLFTKTAPSSVPCDKLETRLNITGDYNTHSLDVDVRNARNQENRNRETTRRVVPVEITTALISCDGAGYDWSDQAEEGPTNFALMVYSSTSSNSEVSTDSNCSSSCLENVKILKKQNEQLLKDLRTSKLNVIGYKTGLESIEARLLVYKKNKSFYEEDIKILKREIHLRENSSKSLSKLLDCQIVDKCKTSLGYNVVPPPYTGNFMPPKPDLSFIGLEEFMNEPRVSESTIKKPVVETSEAKASEAKSKAVRNGALIIEDWVSDNKEDDVPQAKIEKKTVKPSFAKIEFVKFKKQVKSPMKTTVNQSDQNSLNTHSPRGNQRNWNHMMY
ncbi:hypothetical protein Tco_0319559 [Tanacetum coccineum]